MPHCDLDDLALLALDETVDLASASHVQSCLQCREQLLELQQVVVTGKASGGPDALISPPPRVWDAIAEQIATEPVPLAPRRRGVPRWAGLAAACVAGLVIGGGAVAVVTGQNTPTSVVASAELAPMPDGPDRGGEAEAVLNKTDSGYTITVKANGLSGPEGFYEVWLLDEQDSGLIALGSLAPGEKQATFPVPDGVDLDVFSAVDISDEPLDGDPTHSTVTVLRGTLTT